ncbi:MAG: FtsW/RodA/SpoVE family cell cycle protein, partial [Papillibacter sp.]|nr:FtsW/RodA/SpoVE family cell cycle protein [Papillibacter sp.]
LCLVASVYGVILDYSATLSYGTSSYIYVQAASLLIGLGLFFLFSLIDVDFFTNKWYLLLAFNIALICSLFLWGVEGGTGNRSWIRFGVAGIQPSEVIKVTFVLLLAKQMDHLRNSERGLSSVISVIQLVLHFALMFGLIIITSADLGSALVFLIIFIAIIFAGGVKLIWFIIGLGAAAASAPWLWNHYLSDYQKDRLLAPYFPEAVDPDGLGVTWQVNQSKIALGSGGILGQGLTQGSKSQSELLPSKHTDFIFSVAGEELGMIGCILIILLLTVIIIRCVYVGLRSGSYMNMLICVGFSAMLTFQTFENIGMCLGLTPVIGLTLPFFSAGGSSMISCFAAMGIVSGIRMRPKPVKKRRRSGKRTA